MRDLTGSLSPTLSSPLISHSGDVSGGRVGSLAAGVDAAQPHGGHDYALIVGLATYDTQG